MRRSWVWITAGLAVGFGSIYFGFYYFEKPSFARYTPVLAAMADHHVTVDSEGRVDLSRQFPGITGKNDAYVTWRDDGSLLAMFPTYYGEGQQIAGLLYTSRPLGDGDVLYRDGVISFTNKLVSVGSFGYLRLEKKINENWYHVSYRLQ